MKKLILLIFALCSALRLSATAQVPEEIIYNGKSYYMHTLPLHPYFEEHPDILPLSGYIKELPDGSKQKIVIYSTGLYRGYIGTFEIIDDRLMVKDIKADLGEEGEDGGYMSRFRSVMHKVFPDSTQVHANWFTGILTLNDGVILERNNDGMPLIYSHHIFLKIEKGKLVRVFKLNGAQYKQYKKSEFWINDQIEEYYQQIEDRENRGGSYSTINIDDIR